MISKEQILREIADKGSFLHHPGNWDEVNFEDLQELKREGLIEQLSKTNPDYRNADYIYVKAGFSGKHP
jgi:hypothetical protein